MKVRTIVLVAVVAAVTLTSVAAAGPDAAKQRVSITTKGFDDGTSVGQFVLTAHDVGALRGDSGKQTCRLGPERDATRDGQQVSIYDPTVCTYEGKRGTFVARSRNEWVDAGNLYFIQTGTWKVVRGTGQYARVTGGGRVAGVWVDRGPGPWSGNAEGVLRRSD
jgi:hypothetical protein